MESDHAQADQSRQAPRLLQCIRPAKSRLPPDQPRGLFHGLRPSVTKVGKHYSSRVGYYDGFPYFAEQLIDGTIRSKFFPKIYALEWNRARTNFWCIMRRYEKAPKAERTTTSATISATLNMLTGSPNHFGGTPSARYRKAVEQLVDYRLVPDIHAGNIMRDYRSDTPVIIDPILIKRSFRQDFYA